MVYLSWTLEFFNLECQRIHTLRFKLYNDNNKKIRAFHKFHIGVLSQDISGERGGEEEVLVNLFFSSPR